MLRKFKKHSLLMILQSMVKFIILFNSLYIVSLDDLSLQLTDNIYHSWWFITFFILVLAFVIFYGFKRYSVVNRDLIEGYSEIENSNEQYCLYFLFLGVTIPTVEFLVEYFTVRRRDSFEINVAIGVLLVVIYFLSQKFTLVFQNIKKVFTFSFFSYYFLTLYWIVTVPGHVASYFDFLILFVLSYNIFRTPKNYWIFAITNFFILLFLNYKGWIPKVYMVTTLYSAFLISIINHVRYIVNLKVKDNFLFADNIVNKGTSLVIAVNKAGEVVYCSQTILSILGYLPEEVKGFNFWKLTQDTEFTTENYEINKSLYVRKLKCKDGTYKYIQWKDSEYSDDIYLGIGHDVTEQLETQNHYKTLIESASDIIYEIDKSGHFIYLNPFSRKLLNYSENDIIGKHFTEFIREDYVEEVLEFYKKYYGRNEEIPTIEFPTRKKDGTELWISQKVSLTRDNEGKVTGFGAIARDVTLLKKIQLEQFERQKKNEIYSRTINDLVTQQYTANDSFEVIAKNILRSASQGSKIDRISYWNYSKENLFCPYTYSLQTDSFGENLVSYKSENPIYFEIFEKDNIVVASDVYNNEATKEFTDTYFPKNGIKSLLDVPVMVNGQLHSILSFETTQEIRNWDNDDINFARSVSEVISLAIESSKRLETEKRLEEKTKILAAIASSTEILLKKTNIDEAFKEIFSTTLSKLGEAANVDRIYYFENDPFTLTLSQKQEWVRKGIVSQMENEELQNIPHEKVDSMIVPLLRDKIFNELVSEIKDDHLRKVLENQSIQTIVVLPIFAKNQFYGFIGFDDCTNSRKWTDDEIGVLQILSNNISATIERIHSEKLIQESEDKFKLLADNIPGTVYLSEFDDNWTKVYLNDEIEKLTGYNKAEFIKGEVSLIDLVHPEDQENLKEYTYKCIEKSEPFHVMYRLKKKSGEYIWIEEFGDTILKDGKVAYIEGILIDITEKKAIETEIKAREYAEASNKAKSEFLANMSHEIRTPLNAIIGFTDILSETQLDKTQHEYLTTVNKSAGILLDVVNDILDFSKIETGKLNLDIHRVNLFEIANQVLDIIKFDSVQKNIELKFNIGVGVPKYVSTDALRIKQILLNLLSNAVKFTSKGTVELRIDLIDQNEDKSKIRISVIDSGIGIKKVNQDKIFEPFSQEDNSTTRKYGGTGLGLAISNKILNLMNSSLELHSDFRKGSTFYFDLNLEYFSDDEGINTIDVNNLDVRYEDLSHQYLRNVFELEKKILVVEDNKINMLLARTLIKKLMPKANIIEAQNGKIGVERCNDFKPDLILLDIQMPILNGYEAAMEIRKLNEKVPIIALTAGTIKGEREKCLEAGMNDYISKPIDKDIFENMLLKWLQ